MNARNKTVVHLSTAAQVFDFFNKNESFPWAAFKLNDDWVIPFSYSNRGGLITLKLRAIDRGVIRRALKTATRGGK